MLKGAKAPISQLNSDDKGVCIELKEEYVGIIRNYRRGPKTQKCRECLLKVLNINLEDSPKFIGWKVGWPKDTPRLYGVITKRHGRTGILRVKFKKGLPGQALSTEARIMLERDG